MCYSGLEVKSQVTAVKVQARPPIARQHRVIKPVDQLSPPCHICSIRSSPERQLLAVMHIAYNVQPAAVLGQHPAATDK